MIDDDTSKPIINFSKPMLLELFKHLPTETVLSLKGMCKKWNTVANSNLLWKWKYQNNFAKPLQKIKDNMESRGIVGHGYSGYSISQQRNFISNMDTILNNSENDHDNWRLIYHKCQYIATQYAIKLYDSNKYQRDDTTITINNLLLKYVLEMDIFLIYNDDRNDYCNMYCYTGSCNMNYFIDSNSNSRSCLSGGVLTYLINSEFVLMLARVNMLNQIFNDSLNQLLLTRSSKYKEYYLDDISIIYGNNSIGETVLTYIIKFSKQSNNDINLYLNTLLNTYKCDPNKANLIGETPLNCALMKCLKPLSRHNPGSSGSYIKNIKLLLEYGANPNVSNTDGTYPLQLAYDIERDIQYSYKKYTSTGVNQGIKLLLTSYGANPYFTSKTTKDFADATINNNYSVITQFYRDYDFYIYILIIFMILFILFLLKDYVF
jgi:hypothetical protein